MQTFLLSLSAALAPLAAAPAQDAPRASDLLALRVGRAETVTQGAIEHAVILIEGGKIVAIGQDLPVERGIRVIDRPDWVAMPGLVNPYSRAGLESRGGSGFEPQVTSAGELYPLDPVYQDLLEAGVTTLGLYPAGTGVPGQAIAVRPSGDTREEMLISPASYLVVWFRSDARSKKQVRDAFEKVDDYLEKEKKAREKWDKDQEKAKKDADKKKDDEKKADDKKTDEKKTDEKADAKEEAPKTYVPPEPDEKVKPFLALRNGEARALAAISSAGDYLHWLDAVGKEEFQWDLRVPVVRELDLYEVKDKIGEKGCRVLMEPQLSLHPGTMRQRNLPAELAKAGAKLVLIPREDDVRRHESWLRDVGEMIATGLDRDVALRAMTLEPAGLLGLQERLGSLEKGKDANLIFLDGDPFETTTNLQAVMLEGRFVKGEVQQ